MNLATIVITWMDGRTAAYENAMGNVLNGVLHVHTYDGARIHTGTWHFPLFSIRAWGPEEWGGDHGILTPGAVGHLTDSA